MQKVWLVTGSSSGLGQSFVKAICEQGDFVVGTARQTSALADLVIRYPEQVLPMALDVTDGTQIEAVVEATIQLKGHIDGLINNAGYGYRASIEEGEEDGVNTLFQTNFYGPVALIKAVLPQMRSQRSGAIVNISSIAAVETFPGSGYYGASKCALEGMSSALQKEVSPLGIQVMVVEPGAFRTNFSGRSLKQTSLKISDYDTTAGPRRIENDHTHGTQGGDPDNGARLVIEGIANDQPPFKLILGGDAWEVYEQRAQKQVNEMMPWPEKSQATCY